MAKMPTIIVSTREMRILNSIGEASVRVIEHGDKDSKTYTARFINYRGHIIANADSRTRESVIIKLYYQTKEVMLAKCLQLEELRRTPSI